MIPFLLNVIENIMEFKINKYGIKVPIRQTRTWNSDEVKWLIENNGNNLYISNYIKTQCHYRCVVYKCLTCENTNEAKLDDLLKGANCKTCSYVRRASNRKGKLYKRHDFSTIEKCQEFCDVYLPNELTISGKILENKNVKFVGIWKKCKHKFKITANGIKFGKTKSCKQCKTLQSEQLLVIKKELLENRNIQCEELLKEYKTSFSKISFSCVICNHKWNVTFNQVWHQKTNCPFCGLSKGEQFFEKLLIDLNIKYNLQKTFSNCVYNMESCKFDFYLPDLELLIEIHGLQHYYWCKQFHKTENEFFEQQKIDLYKEKYCIENGFYYLAIEYNHKCNFWEQQIKEIFLNYLTESEL